MSTAETSSPKGTGKPGITLKWLWMSEISFRSPKSPLVPPLTPLRALAFLAKQASPKKIQTPRTVSSLETSLLKVTLAATGFPNI
jgi:hypothetical protein